MNPKFNAFFVIALILFSMFPVQAVAPITYNREVAADLELKGAIFAIDATDYYASYNSEQGTIQLDYFGTDHPTDVTFKIKELSLNNRLRGYNGHAVGKTHIADDGTVTHEVVSLVPDSQGFAYLTCDFSTVIISGMTGYTTTTYSSQSGNQSFSVPDGSSYDLNITNNQEGVWELNGRTYQNKTIATINGSMVTTETDIPLQAYIEMIGNNGSDIAVSVGGIEVPKEVESNNDVGYNVSTFYKMNTTADENTEVTFYHGNAALTEPAADSTYGSEAVWVGYDAIYHMGQDPNTAGAGGILDSSGNAEHGTPANFAAGKLSDSAYGKQIEFDNAQAITKTSVGFATGNNDRTFLARVKTSQADYGYMFQYGATSTNAIFGIRTGSTDGFGCTGYSNDFSSGINVHDGIYHTVAISHDSGYGRRSYVDTSVGATDADALATGASSTMYIGRISFVAEYYDGFIGELRMASSVLSANYIATTHTNLDNPTASGTAPFYLSISAPQQASGTADITASITGDSNTQSYNTSQSRQFTLTPTGTTNNVAINTTSTDYDVTITTYWTDDTTLQTETATAGNAKQYINYTPAFDITSADLNTTFDFVFADQDYIGTATSVLNEVSKTTTRSGQDINASVGSLTADTAYWWNVTVPYNNIFTLSEQTDQTAYLGVSKAFTDSVYSDPEGLAIDTRLWNFGDGDTSAASNPSHTYLTAGVKTANYTVTETATVSPQTLTREFNVTVAVQPVQDLVADIYTTNINYTWTDYASADLWNVSELQESAPKFTGSIILDGIKDAIYDTYAHGFVFDTPNPVSNLNYETVLWMRNSTHLIGWATGYDNDDKIDDYFAIGFDASNDNLTTDDRKFILSESGAVTAKRWSGAAWLPTTTSGEGAVVGAGVAGVLTYEMIIPLSEINGFVDNATIKFFMERECAALNPTVETFYPTNLHNNTDATLWESIVLTDEPVYTFLGDTTDPWFNSTGLTPYTWRKHQFITINGTTESDPVYSVDVTQDIPHYSVSGYILNSLGEGIAGANVYGSNGHVFEVTQTDANGYYVGYNFIEGNYSIYANKTAYAQNSIDIYVTGNLTNQNITLQAFEITDWEIYQLLLDIQEGQDGNTTVPETTQPQNSMPLPLFIVWTLILIGLVYVAYPKRDDEEDLEIGIKNITTAFMSIILAFTLAKISINGQLVQTYSGISAINTVVTDVVIIQIGWLSWLFTFIGITMVILTIYLLVSEYNYRYGDDEDE